MLAQPPIIFGASGFIGHHLLKVVGKNNCIPVSRQASDPRFLQADLLNPASLKKVIKPGSKIINLVYSHQASSEENLRIARNIVEACLDCSVSHLIHCSTAIVAGNNPSPIINEETTCYPQTRYEKTKLAIEEIFLSAKSNMLKVSILRPTGVIGPGGQNLKKLLHQIQHEHASINFLRAAFYGKRALNLVPVSDVANALLYLCTQSNLPSGIYICSADDDPDNYYHRVETIIRTTLHKKRLIKPVFLPAFLLKTILKLSRTGSSRFPNRHYSSQKLLINGFKRSMTIAKAVDDFASSDRTI